MIHVLSFKERTAAFLWQHILLCVSLFIMTLGVALCVRSNLGSSVISTIPYVMTLAGEAGFTPHLSIGEYTYLMNAVFVILQIAILRRRFEPVQLFQIIIGFAFGALLDLNMVLTSWIACDTLPAQTFVQWLGCTVLGIGIAFELRCGSVTMPGEGITVAISRVVGKPFAITKIAVDTTLVIIAVIFGYVYFGQWLWQVTGFGTLLAMVYVGYVVKIVAPHIGWFDRLLAYMPGFRRYIYGLARFIYRRK